MIEIIRLLIVSFLWFTAGFYVGSADKEEYEKCLTLMDQESIEQHKLINELMKENSEYRRVKEAYETAIKIWEDANKD